MIFSMGRVHALSLYCFTMIASVWVMMVGAIAPNKVFAQEKTGPVRVIGTLILEVFDQQQQVSEIELPDRKVTLRSESTDVASAVTTLNGGFELIAPRAGIYQVCWELGGSKGCGGRIQVRKATALAGQVRARVERPVVFGTALTGDRRPCWVNDSFFGIDVSTRLTGGGASTRANTKGEYVLIGSVPGTFRLTAKCEGARASQLINLTTSIRQDIVFKTRAPKITGLSASLITNKGVTRVNPGEAVNLSAGVHVPTLNPVQFSWRTASAASGVLSGGNGATQNWTVPSAPGTHSAYVMARDGKGGFAFKRLDLEIGNTDIDFSGRVIDETSKQPLKDTTVTIGTGKASVMTNADGWFTLRIPAQSDDRYVLNLTHPDYALLSRITDRSAVGNTYEMVRAQVTTVRGDQVIAIDDKESGGPCGTAPIGQDGRVRRLVGPTIVWDDLPTDKRTMMARRKAEAAIKEQFRQPQGCDRRGAQIRIPANAFMDETTTPWTGDVRAAVTTLDPSRRSIPGDYQALPTSGTRAELLSYGAVHADFTDPAGRRLQLRPGMKADIAVPVSALQQPTSPPTIAVWSYDENTGVWREEGQASLQNTPQGWMYVGTTTHFSTLNMDVAGSDPAFATCVRFEVDPAFNAWSNLVIRAYVSYGGTSVQVKETPLDNAQYHAIYRIPFNTGFVNTLRLELRGTSNGQNHILLDNIIATDARPHMTGTNLWPPYPYTECGTSVLLTPAPGVIPNYGDYDAANRPAFLSGPFGNAFNPPDGEVKATAYYAAIDPTNNKDTLGKWWQANGFGADGLGVGNPSYVRQAYLNHNDLGFGRDMHCLKNGANVACYVTNYGLPDQNLANADAAETLDATKRGATVAMEFDAAVVVSSSSDERVQFYVFGGGVAASGRIKFADLDGFGPKPVPFLCLVCHGGESTLTPSNKASYARFREFDLPSFRYSAGRSWDFGQSTLTPTELTNFAKLNQMITDAPSGTAISSLVNAWYPGGLGSGAPVLPAPPAGWFGQVSGYHNVYAKSCRTCHVARDEGDLTAPLLFGESSDFQSTAYVVCGTGLQRRRVMPNAVVTYKNFWADSLRVQQYETLTSQAANTCGTP